VQEESSGEKKPAQSDRTEPQSSRSGSQTLNHIAKWNGTSWSQLGNGFPDYFTQIWSLASYDDGTGSALYAAGSFAFTSRSIAKWNGSSWSALGSGLTGGDGVRALSIFDDGAGPALYAGGVFSAAGGAPANNIAKWNGSTWSPLGIGITEGTDLVDAMTVFDNGNGLALYAGGDFIGAGDIMVSTLARWNGSAWSQMEAGTLGHDSYFAPNALEIFDDGTGSALFAGTDAFTWYAPLVPKRPLIKWTGTNWTRIPDGFDGTIHVLKSFDDGTGSVTNAIEVQVQ
jgi:hypothetical protein